MSGSKTGLDPGYCLSWTRTALPAFGIGSACPPEVLYVGNFPEIGQPGCPTVIRGETLTVLLLPTAIGDRED
jgi:hypothetical protein